MKERKKEKKRGKKGGGGGLHELGMGYSVYLLNKEWAVCRIPLMT